MNSTTDLPAPANHVFVDFENVQDVDPAVIGNKTVRFTLLVGPRQTKLAVSLVEKLLEHAASVQLVRLASGGRNALDFVLAYYVGRAVAADPAGSFHIVSKDRGYDPLIEHLQSKHIRARRYNSFATLTLAGPAGLPARATLAVAPKPKSRSKSGTRPSIPDERTTRVLEHLRKPTTNRPKKTQKLISFLVAYLGRKITEAEALNLVENLRQAGHLAIGEKGAITYHLEHKQT
jgi:hypothetical protein